MSCCGQQRQAWRAWRASPPPSSSSPLPSKPLRLEDPTVLRHLGDSSLLIQGDASGHSYLFAGPDTVLTVDGRDVPSLLATGRFASVADST